MTWRDRYKVHPAAAVFPMMPDDELDRLAADIKANGLQSQIAFTLEAWRIELEDRLWQANASAAAGSVKYDQAALAAEIAAFADVVACLSSKRRSE